MALLERYTEQRAPFGAWLLQQKHRTGLVGQLVAAAGADRSFPKQADPEAVRTRLRAMQADGDMFDAIDDAELDWLAL